MACRQFGKPVLSSYQLYSQEQTSVKSINKDKNIFVQHDDFENGRHFIAASVYR